MDRYDRKKINKITINISNEVYEKFKEKSYADGYSMQKAARILMEYYSNDKLNIK